MATVGSSRPVRGRRAQVALLGASAVVLLWVTTPPGTLAFLIRSPITIARDLIARIRPAVAPAAILRKPVGSPFVYLEPTSTLSAPGQGSGAPQNIQPSNTTQQSSGSVPSVPPGSPQPGTTNPPPGSSAPLPETPAPLPETPSPLPESPVPLPEVPNLPEVPSLPEVPDLPGVPDLPDVPDVPGPGDLPGVPGLPDLPSLPLPGS